MTFDDIVNGLIQEYGVQKTQVFLECLRYAASSKFFVDNDLTAIEIAHASDKKLRYLEAHYDKGRKA